MNKYKIPEFKIIKVENEIFFAASGFPMPKMVASINSMNSTTGNW